MRKIRDFSDICRLYDLFSENGCLVSEQVNSDADFEKWIYERLKYDFHDFFIVERGCIYSCQYRPYDSHCRMEYLAENGCYDKDILMKFIRYLFREYPLKNIYMEVCEDDIAKKAMLKDLGFRPEMTLKEYRYRGGTYLDVYVYRMAGDTV